VVETLDEGEVFVDWVLKVRDVDEERVALDDRVVVRAVLDDGVVDVIDDIDRLQFVVFEVLGIVLVDVLDDMDVLVVAFDDIVVLDKEELETFVELELELKLVRELDLIVVDRHALIEDGFTMPFATSTSEITAMSVIR
jgi:hypothetical protein